MRAQNLERRLVCRYPQHLSGRSKLHIERLSNEVLIERGFEHLEMNVTFWPVDRSGAERLGETLWSAAIDMDAGRHGLEQAPHVETARRLVVRNGEICRQPLRSAHLAQVRQKSRIARFTGGIVKFKWNIAAREVTCHRQNRSNADAARDEDMARRP